MNDDYVSPSLEEIFAMDRADIEKAADHNKHWPVISPEAIATLHLRDCAEQLERTPAEPIRLAQAAKSAHLSLQAALTAALAGSMGIGAYNQKLEREWLGFLQDAGEQPTSFFVMHFRDLLKKAKTEKLEWSGRPIELSEKQEKLLAQLTTIRDAIEHVHPGFFLIVPSYVRDAIPLAAGLAVELLSALHHHLEDGELEDLRTAVDRIRRRCEELQD